ncbi:MAG TPA: HupE/UreJ family protein [Blastocatellia bacterium]|nr:HupE/UreJ family protein [Blastocatellia bacterium]
MSLLAIFVFSIHAHPIPFSYLDLRINGGRIDGTLTAHIVDLAHDLNIEPPELLMDPDVAQSLKNDIAQIVIPRLIVLADGQPIELELSRVEPIPDRQALACDLRFNTSSRPGTLRIQCELFQYDPEHQTFLNVYEDDRLLHQEIFTQGHQMFVYYLGGGQGKISVIKQFVVRGIHHIFTGPDHILFITGLLLMGGSLMRLLRIVTAFTIAHSVTLSLAALNVVNPSPRLIEPAIALSIIYVGIDNLMAGERGRDVRAWIALFFGFVHGFGFAGVLKEFGLPSEALGWSLFSFNLGVEIGQACIVIVVASLMALLLKKKETLTRQVVVAGSVCVTLAGVYWFIQRVFF